MSGGYFKDSEGYDRADVFDKSDHQIPAAGQKIFRRKRKHRGEDWGQGTPPTLQDVHRGVWCRRCKKRHPYNGGQAKLIARFEERASGWVTMWCCPVYGDVIGELLPIGRKDDSAS